MTIDKYTSSKAIIEKVYRDTGIQNPINYDDCVNWIFECMEMIGFPLQYIPKIIGPQADSNYDFDNYKVPLPCDFHRLRAISVDGFPVIPSADTFHYLLDGNCCGGVTESSSVGDVFTDNFGNTFNNQIGSIPTKTYIVTFDINDNWITFSQKTGKCCLAYYAFPIDESGFPLIPDDSKYREAVSRYVTKKMDYILWRTGEIPKDIYEHSEKECDWYMGSISGHLKMPSLEQMESLKNTLIKLKPNINQFYSHFKNLNKPGSHRG